MAKKYKHTAYTPAQWASLNPVIVENEIVIEKIGDGKDLLKRGDGVRNYLALPYLSNQTFAEELYSYGVSFDITAVSPSCTRIGHMPFHVSKPVHAGMKGCLVDSTNGTVNGYLTNWSDFNLTGANGSVMVEIPDMYYKTTLNGNIFTFRVSKYPIQGYTL